MAGCDDQLLNLDQTDGDDSHDDGDDVVATLDLTKERGQVHGVHGQRGVAGVLEQFLNCGMKLECANSRNNRAEDSSGEELRSFAVWAFDCDSDEHSDGNRHEYQRSAERCQ